jgi:hypothetical protein
MNRHKRTILAVLLCSLLLVLSVAGGWAAVVLANGTPALDWYVIGGGGGHAEAPRHSLGGTIGQPLVGTATGPGLNLCSGFWCRVLLMQRIYLPLVVRNI